MKNDQEHVACPECGEHEWKWVEPYCEDCGNHAGYQCQSCDHVVDHVWDSLYYELVTRYGGEHE